MANLYVRSTDGSDADNGTTWALAKATLTGAAAIDVAGDTIWVSQVHAESTAAAISFDWAGTAASPIRIICGNDAAEPPTALANTATVSTTGASAIQTSVGSDYLYMYGISFNSGSGGDAASIGLNINSTGFQLYESCNFHLATTDGGSRINVASTSSVNTVLVNCGLQFSNTVQQVLVNGKIHIIGGSILSDAAITEFFQVNSDGVKIMIEGFDFTNGAAAMNIAASTHTGVRCILRNCKMPVSWSGSINSSTPGTNSVWELYNCDSADTNYRLEKKTQFGTITHETTLIKTGGNYDGTTGISWKMVSNADAEWNHQTLDSPERVRWNETTGSAITVTMDILHDSVTNITDKEIWLEVQYLGTSGFPLGVFVDDAAADYITAAADQADSSATWTTTGMSNPNTQKLHVTFTPQEKGYIHAVVKLALASKTVYVDPTIQVS